MKIRGDWLDHGGSQAIFALLEAHGHQVYFVGGCVRNAVLGLPVNDIDLATDALPEVVLQLAQESGLKAVPTGLAHGTVTVISGARAHEITTFRRDVQADGRHAEVAFSTSMAEDAARRDFTMNALYAERDGRLHDPVSGLADLRARHVRFIGDARARIAEDYLRILRFFRFHAWYGAADAGLDPEAFAACAACAEGVARLSGERIGAEMKKLLAARDPGASLAAMAQAGLLWRVMPGAQITALLPLIHLEADLLPYGSPDWLGRAAALGGAGLKQRWKLSNSEDKALRLRREHVATTAGIAELAYRYGTALAQDVACLRAAVLAHPPSAGWRDKIQAQIAAGRQACFPVKARDLMPHYAGRELGQRLAELEQRWIASDFTLSKTELLR